MTQKLYLKGTDYIEVDTMFSDFGTTAKMGMVGGHMIQIEAARPAKPDICYLKGAGFFYKNREPLSKLEDIGPAPAGSGPEAGHIPEPYWSMAKRFIEQQAPTAKPLPVKRVRPAAAAPVARRKPGRPAKRPLVIDGPESFADVAGVSESVAAAQLGG